MDAGVRILPYSLLNSGQKIFQTTEHYKISRIGTIPSSGANFVNDIVFHLQVERPVFHSSCNFPNLFQLYIFDGYNTIFIHIIAENKIIGVKHIRMFDNLLLVCSEISNIKSRTCRAVECLNFQKVLC